jgi:CDP-diglyceride synthetase
MASPRLGGSSSSWKDLPRRLATICLGVPILWWLWSQPTLRRLFFQGLHVAMCLEWAQMTASSVSFSANVGSYAFVLLSALLVNVTDDAIFLAALPCAVAVLSLAQHGSSTNNRSVAVVTGFLLLTVNCRTWLALSRDFGMVISLLLTVWNCDTGALVAGRLLHRRLAIPKPAWLHAISPNKSVVGLIGGVLLGTLTYMSLGWFWSCIYALNLASPVSMFAGSNLKLRVPWTERLLVGLVLSVAAIVGDLWESSLKRTCAVKDTGAWLPGHGGILDRFDSSLLAVGIYYCYLQDKLR